MPNALVNVSFISKSSSLAVLAALLLAACGSDDGGGGTDVGSDASTEEDGSTDVATDTGPDGADDDTVDPGGDAGVDAGGDAIDPSPDASNDGGDGGGGSDGGADAADAAGDGVDDAADDAEADVPVDPAPTAGAAVVAWYAPSERETGGVSVSVGDSGAFGAFSSWLTGTLDMRVPSSDYNLAADVDGDGDDDLIVYFPVDVNDPRRRGSIGVAQNLGDSFAMVETWIAGAGDLGILVPRRVLRGDVDGDGLEDLIAVLPDELPSVGTPWVYRSTGDAFERPVEFAACDRNAPCVNGADQWVGDVDGDGLADLVTRFAISPPSSYGGLGVRRSDGERFGASEAWFTGRPELALFVGEQAVTHLADVNGDGRADVVIVAPQTSFSDAGSVRVLLSNGEGFDPPATWLAGSPDSPVFVASTANFAGDVNGDGLADLILWYGVSGPGQWGSIGVHLSTGAGFGAYEVWRSGTPDSPVPGSAGSYHFVRAIAD